MTVSKARLLGQVPALLLISFAAACGNAAGPASPPPSTSPVVRSNTPVYGATRVPPNGSISASFSEEMDPATLTESTFTLTYGPAAIPVQGTVTYADSKAEFWPASRLDDNRTYSATITAGARSAAGDSLAGKRNWRFNTVKHVVVASARSEARRAIEQP
jgi:hypothetical protein